MINRMWIRCFREGNRNMAIRVAKFLREDFGWDVSVDDDEDRIVMVESSYGNFDCSDIDEIDELNDQELLNQFASDVGLSASRLAKLDKKFGTEASSIGRYTKVPLPKDITKEKKDGITTQAV